MQATALLKSKSMPLPKTLKNVQGSKVLQPSPFAPFSERLIPGLGTSDDASKKLQVMNVGDVTEPPLIIRQDYVVFRADEWILPELNDWHMEAPKVWPVFVKKAKTQLLATWVQKRLPRETLKVNAKAISTLKFAPPP